MLPTLPESLDGFDYLNNPIHDILEDLIDDYADELYLVNGTIKALKRFKTAYYCMKFKLKFIQWHLRTNEARIMEQNHPSRIIKLLASGVDVLELDP
jgi:hypothetical protein